MTQIIARNPKISKNIFPFGAILMVISGGFILGFQDAFVKV